MLALQLPGLLPARAREADGIPAGPFRGRHKPGLDRNFWLTSSERVRSSAHDETHDRSHRCRIPQQLSGLC